MSGPTIDEAVAAFDDEALTRTMVAQLAQSFRTGTFERGALERILETRDRVATLVDAAPDMLDALEFMLGKFAGAEHPTPDDIQRIYVRAWAAAMKARGHAAPETEGA